MTTATALKTVEDLCRVLDVEVNADESIEDIQAYYNDRGVDFVLIDSEEEVCRIDRFLKSQCVPESEYFIQNDKSEWILNMRFSGE